MSRIRSIKPEFFRHEELYDSERASKLPLRIAFAGLWTICDREGRFKWRPRAIKPDVLPYDDVDFAAVLDALHEHGLIGRYEIDGEHYGYIPNFLKHQCPNVREPASTIPEPCEHSTKPMHASWEREIEIEIEREGKSNKSPRAKKARSAKTGLPINFPLPSNFETAKVYWLGKRRPDLTERTEEIAEGFRDYHTSHGTTSASWDASWRTWCRNALEFTHKNGHSHHKESAHEQTHRVAAGLDPELLAAVVEGAENRRNGRDSRPKLSASANVGDAKAGLVIDLCPGSRRI